MKTTFAPTNEYYHRILEAPDAATRRQRYLDLLVTPWAPMMAMMKGAFSAGDALESDPLAGAAAWNWLLPDQVETLADILARLEAADAWRVGGEALAQAFDCFAPYTNRLSLDPVTSNQVTGDQVTGWIALADPAKANNDELGYTGAIDWTQPRFIGQFWDPNPENLTRLPALVAHEMHHLIRMRAFPFGMNTSVADYIVIEGTAEAFAASLFGRDKIGLFITRFAPDELETARRLIAPALNATGFDVIRGYIFGDALAERSGFKPVGGMPTFGGYAIGYHVVQAFLERTGTSIEEATFLPAREIVERSGFFN